MRRLTLTIGAALLLGSLAAPTAAAAATRQVTEKNDVATLVFDGNDACLADYGFTYTGVYVRTRTTTAWTDESGNLIKEVLIIHFDGTETNDSDPTKSLTVNGERRLVFDYVAGTFTETGALRHVTVGGEGIVLQQVGRVVRALDLSADLFTGGPHDMDVGNWAAFCAALA
jgi:Flp pilus assembly protein TadG